MVKLRPSVPVSRFRRRWRRFRKLCERSGLHGKKCDAKPTMKSPANDDDAKSSNAYAKPAST